MEDILTEYNQHTFTEIPPLKNNSFIASINKLVEVFPSLVALDKKFTQEDIAILVRFAQEQLGVNLGVIAEDLKKSTYRGYRKLDIDLLTNFKDYSDNLTDDEKRALWSDPSKQVYYDKATVYLTDNTSVPVEFSELVNNHRQLYKEIDNCTELKQKFGATGFNIMPDTPIPNHELLRIWDTSKKGSNIEYIMLHVAPQEQNQEYDSVFAGAKTYTPEFEWLNTTSVLAVIAYRINEIIHASDFIESVGDQFVTDLTILKNKCEEAAKNAEASKIAAEEAAKRVEEAVKKQQELTVSCTPLDVNSDPEVTYNGIQNHMTFGIPKSEIGLITLSKFAIDTANGHLSFQITNEADVKRVYIDEVTGNVIIELNK